MPPIVTTRRAIFPPSAPGLRNDAYMISPTTTVRVPKPVEDAARKAAPELAGLSLAELIRAGLAILADPKVTPAEAAASARLTRAPHRPRGSKGNTPA